MLDINNYVPGGGSRNPYIYTTCVFTRQLFCVSHNRSIIIDIQDVISQVLESSFPSLTLGLIDLKQRDNDL